MKEAEEGAVGGPDTMDTTTTVSDEAKLRDYVRQMEHTLRDSQEQMAQEQIRRHDLQRQYQAAAEAALTYRREATRRHVKAVYTRATRRAVWELRGLCREFAALGAVGFRGDAWGLDIERACYRIEIIELLGRALDDGGGQLLDYFDVVNSYQFEYF